MLLKSKCRLRGMIVVAFVVLAIITTYLVSLGLSNSPLMFYSVSEENLPFDMEGVVIDLIEMSIDDPPHRRLQNALEPPEQLVSGQIKTHQVRRGVASAQNSSSDVRMMEDQVSDNGRHELTASHGDQKQDSGSMNEDEVTEKSLNHVTQELLPLESVSPREKPAAAVRLEQGESGSREQLEFPSNVPMSSLAIPSESLSLPVPFATLPTEELLQKSWVVKLQSILKKIPRGLAPVSIVSADYKFRDVLLNWIVAAKTQASPPVTHVVVFSLDQELCELLNRRRIHCVYVSPSDFLTSKAIASLTKHIVFSEVMVLRLTAMRLMNYWGFDVTNYDTDAIVLKSPESLYLRHVDSHLIGSYGHHPGELGRVWGTTVCCGQFMTRSSPYTEMFWNNMSTILPKSMNDQARLNFAIASLQPDWGSTESKSIMMDEWIGTTETGFKVTVLPAKYICRQLCSGKHRSEYYVWHKGGQNSDGKMKYAQKGRLWFLSSDWQARTDNSSATGEEWLKEITASL